MQTILTASDRYYRSANSFMDRALHFASWYVEVLVLQDYIEGTYSERCREATFKWYHKSKHVSLENPKLPSLSSTRTIMMTAAVAAYREIRLSFSSAGLTTMVGALMRRLRCRFSSSSASINLDWTQRRILWSRRISSQFSRSVRVYLMSWLI